MGASDNDQNKIWKWMTGPEAGTHFSHRTPFLWVWSGWNDENSLYVNWTRTNGVFTEQMTLQVVARMEKITPHFQMLMGRGMIILKTI